MHPFPLRRHCGIAGVAALCAVFAQADRIEAAVIDLGFALDESGSVSLANYALAKQGLASALGLIPVSGPDTYRVAVVAFAGTSRTIVAPTEVTAGTILGIQATLVGDFKLGGGTDIASAVTFLADSFTGLPGGLGDTTLFNIAVNGQSSLEDLQAASDAAAVAGIDGVSYEAVGAGADPEGLLSVAFPGTPVLVQQGTTPPNPARTGFVFEIAAFADYQSAITATIGRIVEEVGGNPDPGVIPLPAGLPLMGGALGALGLAGWRRRTA